MEPPKKKKKKSGYDYRKEKIASQRKEATSSCSKITTFLAPAKNLEENLLETGPSTSHSNDDNNKSQLLTPNIIVANISSDQGSSCSKITFSRPAKNLEENILETGPSTSHSNDVNDENQLLKPNIIVANISSDQGSSCSKITFSRPAKNLEENILETGPSTSHSKDVNDESQLLTPNIIVNNPSSDQERYEEINTFFKKPGVTHMDSFFNFHPNQPQNEDGKSLPYDINIYFNSKELCGQKFKRSWITYNSKDKKLYCSVCLAYSDGSSLFCQGFNNFRRLSQRVEEHEKSDSHRKSVKCFLVRNTKHDTSYALFNMQLMKRKREVAERRKVLNGVIDVVKLIGKQGLAFRGKRNEEGYTLNDPFINHGNFLEIFLLLSNHNETLGNHVKTVTDQSKSALEKRTKMSKKEHVLGKGTKTRKTGGRGAQITFLSKSTVSRIILTIKDIIINDIVSEIKQARSFAVMMDTTIDISGYDQCAIVLRYLNGKEVKEKLLGLKTVITTTGEDLLETLLSLLQERGLDVAHCIADSFDGASNMNGQYNGVSAKLKELVPNHIHTWCYAHVLNLVISDAAQCLPETISFFGILQETQVFIKESCKRLAVYMKQNPKIRLTSIGATRWRSKSDATTKIFGSATYWFSSSEKETDQPKSVYPDLVTALSIISGSTDFNIKTRNEANALLDKFLSFQTILIAMLFLKIFSSTTPLSDYLQTRNLDFSQAWSFVDSAKKALERNRDRFDDVVKAANKFVLFMTSSLEKKISQDPSLNGDKLSIESELPVKRNRIAKKVHGQSTEEALTNLSEEEKFKIRVFFVVIDKINQTINNRFSNHKELYLDLACFHPRSFPQLKQGGLPENALDRVCSIVEDVDKDKLREELQSLIDVWPEIKSSLQDKFEDLPDLEECFDTDNDSDNDSDDEEKTVCKENKKCKECVSCVFNVIYDYNMYSVTYTELYKVYKFLLTIPLTQVSCERAFSTLKLVKSRLRSSLSQHHLESLLLMQIERGKVASIDNDLIISKLCEQSAELKRILEV